MSVHGKLGTAIVLVILASAACRDTPPVQPQFLLDIATAPENCGDGRMFVASAVGNGMVRLNREDPAPMVQAVSRLREVLATRAEKLVFVAAEPAVPWTEFVRTVAAIWPEAEVVSIATPTVLARARETYCLAPSCWRCDGLRSFGAGRKGERR